MKCLRETNYSLEDLEGKSIFKRLATRAIVLKGEEILLIYTKRYNDYSLPGGGVDPDEDIKKGLLRELHEETGAVNVKILEEFGYYEEHRPTYYDGYDLIHMISYCYLCDADKKLGDASPEQYEIENGSVPVWKNIHKAIAYNKNVIKENEHSMGLSIKRETFLLEAIRDKYL